MITSKNVKTFKMKIINKILIIVNLQIKYTIKIITYKIKILILTMFNNTIYHKTIKMKVMMNIIMRMIFQKIMKITKCKIINYFNKL